MINNKRGASLSGWSETALFLVLFMSVMTIIIVDMNANLSDNKNGDFGIVTNSTYNDFNKYQDTLKNNINNGEPSSSFLGLSLTSTWSMINAGLSITWNFITGQWIEKSINLMQLGDAGTKLGFILRILYFISIGFIAVKLLLKVKP